MTPNDEGIRAAIATQAAEWFVAIQAGPQSESERAAFFAWLRTSPVHVREYLGVSGVAQDLGQAVARPDVSLEAFLLGMAREPIAATAWPGSSRETSRPRTWWSSSFRQMAAVAATAVVLVTAALTWNARDGQWLGLPRSYVTSRGDVFSVRLPDGSMLHIDTASKATVRFTNAERVVTLRRGQLFVQVAHDSTRRFRVATERVSAIAVGTRFNVRNSAGVTTVTVAEGVVSVQGNPASDLHAGRGVRVSAGQSLQVDRAGAVPSSPKPADLAQALAWLEHRIVFNEQPLADVVTEFNRYAAVQIEVDDTALETLPISGSFDASDAESFVQFLETLPGVTVQRTPTRYRVSKAATPD